ncbi:MAG: MFS transporter [Chloroflexi bacterium]|nr:MFS transporter [Chloroflexota bacterium]
MFTVAMLCLWAAMYVYVPVFPVYTELLGAPLDVVGLAVGAYGLTQLLTRIPVGIWSDAIGKRRIFVSGGMIVCSLSAVGLALAPNPFWLVIFRGVMGLAAATWVCSSVLFVSYFPAGESSIKNPVHFGVGPRPSPGGKAVSTSITLSKARQGFKFYCQTANLAKRTIAWYDRTLAGFEAYLVSAQPGETPRLGSIQPNDIRAFIVDLQSRETMYLGHAHRKPIQRKLSPFTIHANVRSLAAFFHWAVRERLLERYPMENIPRPKLPKFIKPRLEGRP